MSTVKWFHYLRPGDRPDGVQKKALLDKVGPSSKSLIVCQELKSRYFTQFDTYFDFARYMLHEVAKSHWCFYEVIFGQLPQKPFFDCECIRKTEGMPLEEAVKMEGVPLLPAAETAPKFKGKAKVDLVLTEEEADAGIECLKTCIRTVCPTIKPEDIWVASSHGPRKLSYHVIVDRWCYPGVEDNKAFHDKIMTVLPPKYHGLIDHGVYTSIRQLRLYRSCKFKSERSKQLSRLSTWMSEVKADSKDQEFVQHLGASLVGNASYCKLLPSFLPPSKPYVSYDNDDMYLSTQDADRAFDLASATMTKGDISDISFPFKACPSINGLIPLRRIAPSHCMICERVHEHENAFLVVAGHYGNVYFYCRRADKSQRKLVGTLAPLALGDIKPLPGTPLPLFTPTSPTAKPPPRLPLPNESPSMEVTVSVTADSKNPTTPRAHIPPLPGVSGVNLAVHMHTYAGSLTSPPRSQTRVSFSVPTPATVSMKFTIFR